MARQRSGVRVLGPYRHGRRFRVRVVDERGETNRFSYETEREACQLIRSLRRELGIGKDTSIEEAIDQYRRFLKDVKQNKPSSVGTTVARLEAFFADRDRPVRSLDRAACAARYEELCKANAVDTHRNVLAEAKTFGKWCVEKRLIDRNPLAEIQGVGRRKKGKPQLRIDEARKWSQQAFDLAERGDKGAVAALLALLMGMRSGEIVSREVRDVDDEGRVVWIPDSKTPAGRRRLQVPEGLRPLLVGLCGDRPASDRLFGDHLRDWVLDQVRRICRAAKVPKVTAHGMRGLHSTLAEESGVSAHAVSRALGHESVTTTHAHYTTATAVANAKQKRALQVLQGGVR